MIDIDNYPQLTTALSPRGKITPYDAATGAALPPMVIQGAAPSAANATDATGAPICVRTYVAQRASYAPGEVVARERLAAAVAAFKADPTAARAAAAALALDRGITPYQAWISLYLRTAPPLPATIWDAGDTTWDSGATIWPA